MRVVVTGGTGFIGRPLCQKLLELRHTVTVFTRNPDAARSRLDPRIAAIGWQGSRGATDEMMTALSSAEIVINLAGAPIAAGRWTEQTKDRLRRSRGGTTSAPLAGPGQVQARPVRRASPPA